MNKKQRLIDSRLVSDYQSGNNEALTRLVKRWHKSFCEKAYWVVKDPDMAKDIAQESWKTIIDKIATLKDPNSFGSWASRIVYTKSLNRIKAAGRKREYLAHYSYEQEVAKSTEGDEEDLLLKKALLKAIKQLPEHQQMVIQLFYVEDYTLKDISDILNISVGTAKSRLFHAREKLKLTLKKENRA